MRPLALPVLDAELDIASTAGSAILEQMRCYRMAVLVMMATLAACAVGCSGINAAQSISPASFLLPALLQADPPPHPAEAVVPTVEPVALPGQERTERLAQAR